MRRLLLLLLTALLVAVAASDIDAARQRARKKPRTAATVKQEQRDTRRAIRQTSEQIDANKRQIARSLNRLDALNADIAANNREVALLTRQVDSLNRSMRSLGDSIATLQARIDRLREAYKRMVLKVHDRQRGSASALAFVFSAESVGQAYRRLRYLREVTAWRARISDELSQRATLLRTQRERLASMKSAKAASLASLDDKRRRLSIAQEETAEIVARLKKEQNTLRLVLKEKESQARALDDELERLIAEEQRRQEEEQRRAAAARRDSTGGSGDAKPGKPSQGQGGQPTYATADDTRSLTGSFEGNKGRLLFPVSGRYRIVRHFGRQKHPHLPHVVIDNAGIDIETAAGADARAVFDGKVSAIFRQPGYNTIVMVRHGRYLTVYAGLTEIVVHNGQTLAQGESIGKVAVDPDANAAVLHFELRREKEKLDPAQWVK